MSDRVGQLVEITPGAWADFRDLTGQLAGQVAALTDARESAQVLGGGLDPEGFDTQVVLGMIALEGALSRLQGLLGHIEAFMGLVEAVPDKIIVVKFCRGVRESKL